MPNLWLIFTTGLLTGGLTCMAVQGGLLAATLINQESDSGVAHSQRARVRAISVFLIAKILAYTSLGFLLGWLGSFFKLSIPVQVALSVLVTVFMVGTALNMLNVHPVFRYFVITPPRFLSRFIRRQSKERQVFAPAMLGALTIFIPCGTTQAMMVLAVGTGNPLLGALTMASFTVGTVPLFFTLGYTMTKLKDVLTDSFGTIAASIIIIMALWNANTALALSGSTVTFDTVFKNVYCTITFCSDTRQVLSAALPAADATIEFRRSGYTVNNPVIKAGSPVTIHLVNISGAGCIQSFIIPKLGIQEVVPVGEKRDIQITAPNEPGTLAFMCGMGMFRGELQVVL